MIIGAMTFFQKQTHDWQSASKIATKSPRLWRFVSVTRTSSCFRPVPETGTSGQARGCRACRPSGRWGSDARRRRSDAMLRRPSATPVRWGFAFGGSRKRRDSGRTDFRRETISVRDAASVTTCDGLVWRHHSRFVLQMPSDAPFCVVWKTEAQKLVGEFNKKADGT